MLVNEGFALSARIGGEHEIKRVGPSGRAWWRLETTRWVVHQCDDLRQMAVEQLENLAIDCAKEEFGYRFGSHDDAKAKVGMRSALRRQIARIATILAEKREAATAK